MSVDFGRNTDETIGMNSSRTIGSHTQRLTVPGWWNAKSVTGSAGCMLSDIGDWRGMAQWTVNVKTLEASNVAKMMSAIIIPRLKKLGAKNL